jgi:pilus assembly protein CpaE
MSEPYTIDFGITPEKMAQLDLMAKALDCDRSYLLNKAVDTYFRLTILDEHGIESTELMNKGEAGAMVGSPMPNKAAEAESARPMQADPDPPIHPMLADASMFLAPPASPGKMEEAQVQFPILAPGKTKARLLIFLSTKGGSGVTTVACNFAVSLVRESRKRVLLIDLNLPLGDVALNLGIKAKYTTLNAFQHIGRLDSGYLSALLEQHSSGLFVLAAPSELTGADVSSEAIIKLLEVAGEEFDYVVVDAGTTLDTRHIYTFDKSSIIYVVTQIGISELRNSNRLISKFPVEGGPGLEIVINRFDPRSQEIDEKHVIKALTRPARWRIPNDYAAVRRMQNTATPLSGNSPISRTIQQMAKCVCGTPCTLEPSKSINFFGWKISRG